MDKENIEQLLTIMAKLRDEKSGCPWDKKQTFESVIPYTIEETYEVVDAINNQDWGNLKEELGDLLFQVIFYSQIAKEKKLFDFSDVVSGINQKLTRRHPHVFSDQVFANDQEIAANWEREKAKERLEKQQDETLNLSVLDTVPVALPALSRARKLQSRCAKFGFDWDTFGPVADKVKEEIDEVIEEVIQVNPDQDKIEEELGDLLFSVVNMARHLGKDPEQALAKANHKFARRFKGVETKVTQKGKVLEECSLEELDQEWENVKLDERN
ncbi:nucleoside triphosphate pyrophosphohydrolase [Aliivibrio kagoshimensis]|uniref:nucleoside triphosphate pyrophosphohydrolase n=1 Tax=Aliivibrio kagoshimensis TaxID=2910230 RepID=UPI003D0BB822